jgi:hypothetical protein
LPPCGTAAVGRGACPGLRTAAPRPVATRPASRAWPGGRHPRGSPAGGGAVKPAAARHLKGCGRCRILAGGNGGSVSWSLTVPRGPAWPTGPAPFHAPHRLGWPAESWDIRTWSSAARSPRPLSPGVARPAPPAASDGRTPPSACGGCVPPPPQGPASAPARPPGVSRHARSDR